MAAPGRLPTMSVVQKAASITSLSCPTAAAKPANTASGSDDGFHEGRREGRRERGGREDQGRERWEEGRRGRNKQGREMGRGRGGCEKGDR